VTVVTDSSSVGTSVQHDHERAEQILAGIEGCGDRESRLRAQEEAVLLTLNLADRVARRYVGRGIDAEDLLQVARMALVKAVRGYRSGRGSCFAAYAVPTISGEIKRHFRDCGWAVRPPRRMQEVRADLAAAEESLRQTRHRQPSTEELATCLNVTASEVREAQQCSIAYRPVSMDVPAAVFAVEHQLAEDRRDEYAAFDDRVALADALSRLSDREREIVRLRFVEERTQSEIGRALGISQMQVSRLLTAILRRLHQDLIGADRAA
jgi:RNA polymerase sigma-B factor